jgi:hypothetical protein
MFADVVSLQRAKLGRIKMVLRPAGHDRKQQIVCKILEIKKYRPLKAVEPGALTEKM